MLLTDRRTFIAWAQKLTGTQNIYTRICYKCNDKPNKLFSSINKSVKLKPLKLILISQKSRKTVNNLPTKDLKRIKSLYSFPTELWLYLNRLVCERGVNLLEEWEKYNTFYLILYEIAREYLGNLATKRYFNNYIFGLLLTWTF